MVAVDSGTTAGAVQALDVEDEHVELLADFYREVWDPGATPEGVLAARRAAAAANPVDPGRAPPTVALVSEGRIIGYVTTIPAPVWSGGREHGVYWVKGLMVLPEQRNGPVGYLVLRQILKHVGPAMGIVVQPQARKLFQALGFRDAGTLSNFAKPIRPAAVLRRLDLERLGMNARSSSWMTVSSRLARTPLVAAAGGALARVGLGALAATSGRTGRIGYEGAASLSALDFLWARMRDGISAGVVRSGEQLDRRYLSSPEHYRVRSIARPGGEVVGAAIVRRPRADGDPRLNGIRVATLSELLCDPDAPRDVLGTIAQAERCAMDSGADLLLASASDLRFCRALGRRGFLRIPANLHLLTRFPRGESELPAAVDGWWLTRGDSGADEVF